MKKRVKIGDKVKASIKGFSLLLRKYFIRTCKFFDDSAHHRADNIFNLISVYILVAIAIFLPAIPGASTNNSLLLQVFTEIIYAVFVLFFIACSILYHKKSIWCWISIVLFIAHYITLIDSGAEWNRVFTLYYLGVTVIFFCSWISWASAKDINKKGGLVDTILLAVGLALSLLGAILKDGNYEHYKYVIAAGIAIVYLYAISRVLLWIFAPQEKVKLNLLKVIVSVAFYLALLVGFPFLLSYAGVKDEVLTGIVIPIYSASIGGILTLAGVAWTIKKQDAIRNDEEKKKYRPILLVTTAADKLSKAIPLTEFPENQISYNKSEILVHETYINPIIIRNTEFTPFYIYGLMVDEFCVLTESKIYIDRGGSFVISCEQRFIYTKDEIRSISLLTQDLLGNFYLIPMKFDKILSNKIGQPYFRQGTIMFMNRDISQIICKDELQAIELINFSLKED